MKQANLDFGGFWYFLARRPNGRVRWFVAHKNLVVNVGLDYFLDVALGLNSQAQISSWYVGLKGSGTPAAADTMSSHASWSEITDYSESTRPQWQGARSSGETASNSANKAQFTMSASTTVYGAFLTSDNTKGGTSGTLLSAGDFSSSKALSANDVLNVQYDVQASSS